MPDLPANVTTFLAGHNQLDGSLRLSGLEHLTQLHTLELDGNRLSGSIDLSALPPALASLSVADNDLGGELHLFDVDALYQLVGGQSPASGKHCPTRNYERV